MIDILDHADFITPAGHQHLRQARTETVWGTHETAKSVPSRLRTWQKAPMTNSLARFH